MVTQEEIRKRKNTLSAVRKNLKSKFIGIDVIIDRLIDSITAWYLFPEVSTRPLIINLWGMTGVGKTDLIRNLVSELDMQDKFAEIQMCSANTREHRKTVRMALNSHGVSPTAPGILLLDEIQRFRSIDDCGHELECGAYPDLWTLLSDGRSYARENTKDEMIESMCELISFRNSRGSEQNSVSDDKTDNSFRYDYYSASQWRCLLKEEMPIMDFMRLDEDTIINMFEKAIKNPETYEAPVYKKLLIIISGNLDEAYMAAGGVAEADVDADICHASTKNINVVDIKTALKTRFFPEQIARFGNTHIIYPSLSKEAFREIISTKMAAMLSSLSETLPSINIVFDSTINDMIYDNGVFPSQGVRPTFTTIDNFFNECMPDICIDCLDREQTRVVISYDSTNDLLASTYDDGSVYIRKYVGALDSIRKKKRNEQHMKTLVAVHEAGHAVIYAKLFGVAPFQLKVNTTSSTNEGFVMQHRMTETEGICTSNISVCYGGMCAEEIVFGGMRRTTGCVSDIKQATKIAAGMIRRYGMGKSLGVVVSEHDDDCVDSLVGIDSTDQQIERILLHSKSASDRIIRDNIGFLVELTDVLVKKEIITNEEFASMATRHGIECVVGDGDFVIIEDYADIFSDFKSRLVAV